ncbi:hypothetical protein AB0I53_00495 [Saccharopolyspora sp. NPDC050389]|uniref:hypothetical protein n=1 Tax=Saccharopolyspora sp. NPDC050389 TaxID=3155516 RepID=UPI0033DFDDD3
MDEVKAMARAGESVGKAVGTGLKSARHGAKRAGEVGVALSKQAASLAEQELANHGYSADELQERIAQRATGMSRKELAKRGRKARKQWEKKTEQSRKQLAKNTIAARKELAARIDPGKPKGRRKWPWVLLVLAGLGAAVAVAFSRRPEELPIAEANDGFPRRDTQARHRADRPDVPAQTDGQSHITPERSR